MTTQAIDVLAPGTQPTADDAYRVYVADGCRSYARVAAILGIPDATVRSWARRYKWQSRVRDLDTETLQGVAQSVVVATAAQQQQNIATLREIRDDVKQPGRVRVAAAKEIREYWDRIAHLIPQLVPPAEDEDADILELVQSPDGVARLLQSHRDTAGKR